MGDREREPTFVLCRERTDHLHSSTRSLGQPSHRRYRQVVYRRTRVSDTKDRLAGLRLVKASDTQQCEARNRFIHLDLSCAAFANKDICGLAQVSTLESAAQNDNGRIAKWTDDPTSINLHREQADTGLDTRSRGLSEKLERGIWRPTCQPGAVSPEAVCAADWRESGQERLMLKFKSSRST
jgi:hypothetical protein